MLTTSSRDSVSSPELELLALLSVEKTLDMYRVLISEILLNSFSSHYLNSFSVAYILGRIFILK